MAAMVSALQRRSGGRGASPSTSSTSLQSARQRGAHLRRARPIRRPRRHGGFERRASPPAGEAGTGLAGLGEACEGKVVVVGAGIAGLAVAAALKRKGVPCIVLEKRPEPSGGFGQGTAIALWKNAWRALDALEVGDALRQGEGGDALNQVELCAAEAGVLKRFSFDECDGGPHEFRGVFREALLGALASKLEPGDVRYGVDVVAAQQQQGGSGATIELGGGGGEAITCRAVVGCDGVGSNVCKSLALARPGFAGYSAVRGVAKFKAGGMPFESRVVRQILGKGTRAGMYPLSSTHVYWFVCFNSEEGWAREWRRDGGRGKEELRGEVEALVRTWGHGIREVVAATPSEGMVAGAISDRWLAPASLTGAGPITIAGDALHPMTPNLGQGGCCALEDAIVLADRLAAAIDGDGGDVSAALRDFERRRLERCLPLTVRAWAMGFLLQIDNPLVCAVRDAVVQNLFSPKHFLDHTEYDCTTG